MQTQKKMLGALLVVLWVLGTVAWCWAGQDGDARAAKAQSPPPAHKGLGPRGELRPSPGDHCPVCGMFPARRPKHAAALELKDGRTFYFCSNGCLLRCWRRSRVHLNVPPEAIKRMRVHDYFSGAAIDAHSAWWVAGSDVIGPMGPALVALQSRAAVQTFRQRHGGRNAFQLHQVDDALWKKITTGKGK